MAKTRTFIGIAATDELRSSAQELTARLQPHVRDVRWVLPENLHYTLSFLGDISDQDLASVCGLIEAVASDCEPFSLETVGVRAFPSLSRPRTIWIGAGEGAEELCNLQGEIEQSLAGLGFRGENRQYVPHLTIGRAGRTRAATANTLPAVLESLTDFSAGTLPVDEVTIYASRLRREGPEYSVLARCGLVG